jgi:flavin-dependent dehydrogenase
VRFDVAIVGGGPAGLAVAIEARLRGLSAIVLERQTFPVDKACGEGLMPAGLAALVRLGVLSHLDLSDTARFDAIRYVQEDGRYVDGVLPAPGGLGIRRLALSRALVARARSVGAQLREGTAARSHEVSTDGVAVGTDSGALRARFLVAADGLHSALRRSSGLVGRAARSRRFGVRRHFAIAPWAPRVEVHFADGAEAYVTPAGAQRVGVAFLWDARRVPEAASFEFLLAKFPKLAERVRGAAYDSEARGAGPLEQRVRRRTGARFALIGDAAGSVDAITGEGLSLAFEAASVLGAVLPEALESRSVEALAPYERAAAQAFDRYARLAGGLAWVAARPGLRRLVVNRLIATPGLFSWALQRVVGPSPHPLAMRSAELVR